MRRLSEVVGGVRTARLINSELRATAAMVIDWLEGG
jgi:hypothetical protein